ncbi:peptide-methionine (S)-S-oxide reductase [Muriicola jejuensis]|uniref:Peptide methionine sulfoxide reductase MsrA n=1 Tax=Muriicola jejuensis TaxID=504488 RepID=A0A6P0UCK6_9FLAO|nr:peptide-methionine (S)-S-oxide reductase MsrA [Muriicola jejuensis]NER10777.1 peptide-methionine (S)-S-oxide reductase MsrA [Muriicola jejuensis]SMP16291.1 peptide-methionine (S)-S-oxide reductase [Muriicola jejuensis]
MKLFRTTFFTFIALVFLSCQTKAKDTSQNPGEPILQDQKISEAELQQYETAYFASGCFWCVEAIFESVKGVKEAVSGYAGGTEENPTYEQVSYGRTTHAEAVEVYYDPEKVSFFELVQVFYGSHDPTTLNRQGPDRGAQYRSIAFYKNEEERKIIEAYQKALDEKGVYGRPIVTEIKPFTTFWKAEEYHQDYERRHPNDSYIRNVSIPRLNRFKENFPKFLKPESH